MKVSYLFIILLLSFINSCYAGSKVVARDITTNWKLQNTLVSISFTTKYGVDNDVLEQYDTPSVDNHWEIPSFDDYDAYKSKKHNVIKSMLVPGWGQFSTGQHTKGALFLASELSVLGLMTYYYIQSNCLYDKYLNSTQIDDIQSCFNAASKQRSNSQICFGIASLIWIYNILDIIIYNNQYMK